MDLLGQRAAQLEELGQGGPGRSHGGRRPGAGQPTPCLLRGSGPTSISARHRPGRTTAGCSRARSSDGFRIIRIVRAGYGSGPAPVRHLTISDHAAHCAALLEHLGLDQAHVVGHSSGSAIGLQLALDRPDLVGSLILSEPPLFDDLVAPEDLDFVRTDTSMAER